MSPGTCLFYGREVKEAHQGAFLTDARRRCLDADPAREYEVDGVDNSNRSMCLGEGSRSSPEALLEAEITRGQVILVPSRVQAPTADTKNTGVVDRFDAVHYNPDTRGQVHDPVVRVRPGAGDVTKPGLYATGAVCNRDVSHLHGGGARRIANSHSRRRHRLRPRTTGRTSHTQSSDSQERQHQRSASKSHLRALANYLTHVLPLPVFGAGARPMVRRLEDAAESSSSEGDLPPCSARDSLIRREESQQASRSRTRSREIGDKDNSVVTRRKVA